MNILHNAYLYSFILIILRLEERWRDHRSTNGIFIRDVLTSDNRRSDNISINWSHLLCVRQSLHGIVSFTATHVAALIVETIKLHHVCMRQGKSTCACGKIDTATALLPAWPWRSGRIRAPVRTIPAAFSFVFWCRTDRSFHASSTVVDAFFNWYTR